MALSLPASLLVPPTPPKLMEDAWKQSTKKREGLRVPRLRSMMLAVAVKRLC